MARRYVIFAAAAALVVLGSGCALPIRGQFEDVPHYAPGRPSSPAPVTPPVTPPTTAERWVTLPPPIP